MTRLVIFAGIVLALVAGPLLAFSQETETASVYASALPAERMGDRSALWEQIKAGAVEDPRVMADPAPETPDMLPALWDHIKANADEPQ